MGWKKRLVKAIDWMDDKKIAVLAVVILSLSLIPVLYLAQYARPSGDDYGYSVLTHAAWLNSHSLIEVFKAGIETVRTMYMRWNGDWFTVFLFSLMPEVFAPYTFWIVPYIMVGILILGTSVFIYYIFVKICETPKEYAWILNALILFVSIQFIPSTAIGMYWYVGAAHYIIPHTTALLALVFGFEFYRSGKKRNILFASLCMFMVGGSSYFSSLLVFIVFAVMMILFVKKRKNILALLIPFSIGAIGFVIQCISPGNKVRAGESFGFHAEDVLSTIIESLFSGIVLIGELIKDKPFVVMVLFLCAVFGWQSLLRKKSSFKFRFPLLFIGLMYGIYSAMYAPGIYSAVDISLGPDTMVYLTFLLCALLAVIYGEGWIIDKLRSSESKKMWKEILLEPLNFRRKALFPLLALSLVIIVLNLGWLGSSVNKRAYDYVSSGQAEDFKEQIKSQMDILLDDSIKEAYLVPINNEQGPLMHMPVTDNPDAFTNRVVKEFYGKDIVILAEPEE